MSSCQLFAVQCTACDFALVQKSERAGNEPNSSWREVEADDSARRSARRWSAVASFDILKGRIVIGSAATLLPTALPPAG